MRKTKKRHKQAAHKPRHKNKYPERKTRSGVFFGRSRMDIAIQATAVVAALLGVATVIVGTSSVTNKFTITLWLGFATAVLILLGGCLYWQRQHWEAEAKAAAELTKAHRPELFIEEAQITPLVVGKTHTVVMLLRNRGDGHARNIKLGPNNYSFKAKDFAGPLMYGEGLSPIDTPVELAAGAAIAVAVTPHALITDERSEQLIAGDLLYFHYAEGSYSDDAGRMYQFDYCFMYTPMAPTILRVCPNHYRPKKDREEAKNS